MGQKPDDIRSKPAKVQLSHWLQALKKAHGAEPGKLKLCLTTMRLYANNAAQNKDDPKYHKIKKANKGFTEKVAVCGPESLEVMRVLGFKDTVNPDFMAI